jgi:hypothetical protein
LLTRAVDDDDDDDDDDDGAQSRVDVPLRISGCNGCEFRVIGR